MFDLTYFFHLPPGAAVWAATGAVALLALAAAVWAAVYGLHARRTMKNLERMLEECMSGGFSEHSYSEQQLSRLEARLARFLQAGALSQKHLESDRARLKELIGDISHQTKTPLAGILLYTQLLQEQELPQAARAMTRQIDAQGQRLQFLIDALVKMSRLETGAVQVAPFVGDVGELMEQAAAPYRAAASEKQIDFTVEPAEQTAWFDPKWTAEALGNLIDNAVKYTPAGGRVTVRCAASPMFCRITVQDTGPGIREAEQGAVFGRFWRGEEVRGEPGVGVGLYLAREIAGLQSGYIKLQSKPGQGSAFSLYLLLEKPA